MVLAIDYVNFVTDREAWFQISRKLKSSPALLQLLNSSIRDLCGSRSRKADLPKIVSGLAVAVEELSV
jgi:hypothetical protein